MQGIAEVKSQWKQKRMYKLSVKCLQIRCVAKSCSTHHLRPDQISQRTPMVSLLLVLHEQARLGALAQSRHCGMSQRQVNNRTKTTTHDSSSSKSDSAFLGLALAAASAFLSGFTGETSAKSDSSDSLTAFFFGAALALGFKGISSES